MNATPEGVQRRPTPAQRACMLRLTTDNAASFSLDVLRSCEKLGWVYLWNSGWTRVRFARDFELVCEVEWRLTPAGRAVLGLPGLSASDEACGWEEAQHG